MQNNTNQSNETQKYYVYRQTDGMPCVTTTTQDLELIGTADSYENAEKMLKLALLIMLNKKRKKKEKYND